MIKMIPVKSSNICRVGHDGKSELLIQFGDTNVAYQYAGVPVELFESLLKAESVGRFVNHHVKNAYACRKVEISVPAEDGTVAVKGDVRG